MKHAVLKTIKEIALGHIKKYSLIFEEANGDSIHYDLVTRNIIKNKSDLGKKVNAVSVIVYDTFGRYVLLKEFRYALNDYVVDFPAGIIEPDETIMDAAKRELFEETGLTAKNVVRVIDGGYSSAGMTDECVAICILQVDDVTKATNKHVDGNEVIEFMFLNMNEMSELICQKKDEVKISNRVQFYVLGNSNFVW